MIVARLTYLPPNKYKQQILHFVNLGSFVDIAITIVIIIIVKIPYKYTSQAKKRLEET